jgi:hypothetical protein
VPNKLTESLTVAHGENVAHHIAGLLIAENIWFQVEPMHNGQWRILVELGDAEETRERIGI